MQEHGRLFKILDMPLLQTYGKYKSYIDPETGKHRVIWQFADGNILCYKFDTEKTEAECETFFAQYLIEQEFGQIEKLQTVLNDNENLIKEVIVYIRNHPNLTLAQWNTVLSAKQWHEQVVIRAFIYKLALLLAQHYGIVLDNFTEAEILKKLRNWVCSVNVNVLKRVIFGKFLNLE